MQKIHWFETKQLDRVTNYSTEIECVNFILNAGYEIYYYCTFAKKKNYFCLNNNIKYLGCCRNKYVRYIEFRIMVTLKSLQVTIFSNHSVLMVNPDLVKNILPSVFVNKLLRKKNVFILDVRTLPTSPDSFEKDMESYNRNIHLSVKHFDGLSFITPFLEKTSLSKIKNEYVKTVNWSSGVNLNIFNANKYNYNRDTDAFRIFYHGGISLSRGNLDLIKACEKVVDKGYHLELLQIGKIVDVEILNYIEERKIGSWCKLYDAKLLSDMPELIAKCDLPLLPFPNFMAWRTSSPIKLMEYLAMGKPILVPNIECFTDILPADSGLVHYYNVHADNIVEEIENSIIKRIKGHNACQRYVKNQQCIDYVASNFTWEKQTNRLLKFCIKLCEEVN